MKYSFLIITIITLSCNHIINDPQKIIDQSMKASGSNMLQSAAVEFEFRDREYGVKYDNGKYEMIRLWGDSIKGVYRDVVSNSGFQREINGTAVVVPDSMASKYASSINSVIYYALLPYRLNDEAVIKKYLGSESIKDQQYDMIEITFKKEGGGKDYDDVYIYWINSKTKFVDYFCYSYSTDGGGIRFREAINPRIINGVRIVDYNNFEVSKETPLDKCAQMFEANELQKISVIELQNVMIKSL